MELPRPIPCIISVVCTGPGAGVEPFPGYEGGGVRARDGGSSNEPAAALAAVEVRVARTAACNGVLDD